MPTGGPHLDEPRHTTGGRSEVALLYDPGSKFAEGARAWFIYDEKIDELCWWVRGRTGTTDEPVRAYNLSEVLSIVSDDDDLCIGSSELRSAISAERESCKGASRPSATWSRWRSSSGSKRDIASWNYPPTQRE